jgi:S-DNA-T family DNA segregation ATPase FtsK/SpoIIIE
MTAPLSPADRDYLRDLARTVGPEARLYLTILQFTLVRLGEFYAPTSERARGKSAGGRGVQRVQFERVCLSPEIIAFKIRVHKRVLWRTLNALPHKTRLADLMNDETAHELSHACRRRVTWFCDDEHPEWGAWFFVHRGEGVGGIPTLVEFKDILGCYPQDMGDLPLVLGSGQHRTTEMISLRKTPHLMVVGATNLGKSNALNSFILALMHYCAPDMLRFVLVDLKEEVEVKVYRTSPHLYCPIVGNVPTALRVLKELFGEIRRRLSLLGEGEKDWTSYRANHPDAPPFILCIIDEYAQFIFSHGPNVAARANALLIRIAAQGRAAGVQLIVATQYPTGEVIHRQVRVNFGAAISFHCMTGTQSRVALDVDDAKDIPDLPGRALYTDGRAIHEVQMPYVSAADTAAILAECKAKYGEQVFEATASQVAPLPDEDLPPEPNIVIEMADPRRWFAERALANAKSRKAFSLLYDDYSLYADQHNQPPMGRQKLSSWLQSRGFVSKQSNGVRYMQGITLKQRASTESAESTSTEKSPIDEEPAAD